MRPNRPAREHQPRHLPRLRAAFSRVGAALSLSKQRGDRLGDRCNDVGLGLRDPPRASRSRTVPTVRTERSSESAAVAVEHGEEALNCASAKNFDLIVLDIEMPVMDGIEATRRLRTDWPSPQKELPVLVLTANVSSEDHQRCVEVGANALVLKPFDRQQLCALIEEHLLLSPAFLKRLNTTLR